MLKRIFLTAGGLGLLTVLAFGTQAYSYVRTSMGWVNDSVKNSVPLEFEIDRARKMVKDLVPDIRKNMQTIAQEEVEVERLEQQVATLEATRDRERGEILRLKSDLSTNQSTFNYGGRVYTMQQVKVDLANRFDHFKTQEATLASLHDICRTRQKSLEAARQKLDAMWTAKRKLEVDVENLGARLKMVEVAQTTSNYNFDDSELGRAKELMADLRARLSVAERLASAESSFGEISLSEPVTETIVDQVTEYFSTDGIKLAQSEVAR